MTTASGSDLQDDEARAFLQQRVALFGLASALLSGSFLLARIVMTGVSHPIWHLFTGSYTTHAASVSGSVFIWLVLRRGRYERRSIQIVETIGLGITCVAFETMSIYIPPIEAPFHIVTMGLSMIFFSRAVAVPSSARRTFGLMMLVGVPLVALTYFRTIQETDFIHLLASRSPLLRDQEGDVAGHVATYGAIGIGLWWGAATAVCTFATKVVYGLRREIREAHRLGQYLLEAQIGAGGMGEVYRAGHLMLRRPTAVKLLRPERVSSVEIARFEREVQLTAQLTHPNIVTIYDYGRTPDGIFYYAMELLDGPTLQDVVDSGGPQSPARVAAILRQMLSALREAHEIGLIHRDIKPGNVLLCKQGGSFDVVKVVDFGLAKPIGPVEGAQITQLNVIAGTPLYMAPESITHPESTDARTDLYALGAVGYFLLTGTTVFAGSSVVEVCSHHLHTAPEPPSQRAGRVLHAGLEQLILRCLKKSPAERPASAQEALRALAQACADLTWSEDDARNWWSTHAPALKAAADSKHTPGPHTIAVDLARRVAQPVAHGP